jgi:hypothetical protein
MSRSVRHTPVCGNTTARSDKWFKSTDRIIYLTYHPPDSSVAPDRPALTELQDIARIFLRQWEDSDSLPSEAARELVARILRFRRLDEARAQLLSEIGHVD